MHSSGLDPIQAASAAQFDRQSDRYGKNHILADTTDVAAALTPLLPPAPGARVLDVATGGGHTALWLVRHGWQVTAADIAPRMLANARALVAAETGRPLETLLAPAEALPCADASFDLVTVRVAPHHFSSPAKFVAEVRRVVRPGGHFLLIDGTVPDDDPVTAEWLHGVEKLRDPSHGRFLSRAEWTTLVTTAGLTVLHAALHLKQQPDLDWYFDAAATPAANRTEVLAHIRTVPASVQRALQLRAEPGAPISWWWPMLTLLARRTA